MNRPGQPPQRPPSLGPNPGLAGPFRGPYPTYGMPPRSVNVLQGGGYVPGLQPSNHRTSSQTQSMLPQQPTPGFMQQRGSSFAFGGGLGQATGQHQSSTLQQPHSANPQSSQANGTSTPLPPHLAQNTATPSLGGTAPSVSSASEVGLDPNDFPALGSTPANTNNSNSNGNATTTSYASQAGTALAVATGSGSSGSAVGASGTGNSSQPRDFTPDDFPALGGQPQSQSQNQSSQDSSHPHPPGLNGFQHNDHSQHRPNLLGSLGGGLQTPGMLNLGPTQSRSVHPGFQQSQSEAEKQQQRNNYALKLNQATHAAWNSPNVNPGSQSQSAIGASVFSNPNPTSTATTQQNGTHPPSTQNPVQQQQSSQGIPLNAPPGVPPPTAPGGPYTQQQQDGPSQPHPPGTIANVFASNGDAPNPNSNSNPQHHPHATHPQTPAQQVLMSAADRWGLLGLLAMIKNAGTDVDQGLSSVGTDLGTMGLDMGYAGNLYSTFITPWADQSAAHTVEPDFHLPGCYNVQPPPPGPNKATAFSDETLFFMFYSSPRDALQEVAAQELWNRNWRFHKDLRIWITKETGTSPSQKVPGGEQGTYTIWDPENWGKERKEMAVLYADLEEKSVPVFVQGPGLVLAQAQGAGQQPQPPQGQTGQAQQAQGQRGSFPVGLTGL